MAQLDARPTGNQEFADLTPLGWQHFHEDLIMKYFLQSFSPFRGFKKGSWSVSGKRMCTILVNLLED